jgi:hypothetical protein
MRPDEIEAGVIVAAMLGGQITPLDVVGAADLTPDFDVVLDDGTHVALEITSTADRTVLSLVAAAFGKVWEAPGLANDWQVGVEQPTHDQTVRMISLMKGIVPLLAVFEHYGVTEVGSVAGRSRRPPLGSSPEVVDAANHVFKLGAVLARLIGPSAPSGTAQLFVTVHGGASSDINEVNRLVTALAESNSAKLVGSEADERHLFVWVHPSTSNAELAVFQGQLPASPPGLPLGIDVAWVATQGFLGVGTIGLQRLLRVRPPQAWEQLDPSPYASGLADRT